MLDFLFGRSDPSRGWQRSSDLALTYSLDAAQLNTARLGSAVESVSFLGPAEDSRAARKGTLCYRSLGIIVTCDDRSAISCFELVFRDPEGGFQSYRGRITYDGNQLNLAEMNVDQFLRQFEGCFWQDVDDEETILFYEFPRREWQVEFNERKELNRLLITSEPLMADPQQRDAYGVTQSWPPASAKY